MNQYVWIALSLTFGVLAGGLPLWFITYDSLSLTAPGLVLTWIVTGALAAGIVARLSQLARSTISLLVACGFVIAVLGRVMVEVVSDPRSHTNWPLELVITIIISTPAGLLGAYIGRLLKQRSDERNQNESQM